MKISEQNLERRFNDLYAIALTQPDPDVYLIRAITNELTLIALECDSNV